MLNMLIIFSPLLLVATIQNLPKSFEYSMQAGQNYCPAPIPAATNKELGERVLTLAQCRQEGLCLALDGSSCVEPIIWGNGMPKHAGKNRKVAIKVKKVGGKKKAVAVAKKPAKLMKKRK